MKIGLILSILTLSLLGSLEKEAHAGVVEISGSAFYSQSSYGDSNFTWTRRWGVSVGYYFLALSEIEFSVQDIFYKTKLGNREENSFHDQVYSVDWVQSLASKNATVQPYFKVGIGQLNREAVWKSAAGTTGPILYDSVTGVAGAGFRVYVLKNFSLKVEASTYLMGGMVSTAKDNFSFTGGVSVYF
jgi:hypothetical protein